MICCLIIEAEIGQQNHIDHLLTICVCFFPITQQRYQCHNKNFPEVNKGTQTIFFGLVEEAAAPSV